MLDGVSPPHQLRTEARGTLLEFEFSLRFELEECDGLLDVAMERLEATGNTSTLLGASINAVLELQFVRRAASAQEALTEATATVEKAFPGARLVSISPAPDTPAA